MARITYVIRNGELVDKRLAEPLHRANDGPFVISDVEPFVSPVDNRVIGGARQLREHNARNEVVDRREFQGHKFERPSMPSAAADIAEAFKQHRG